MKFKKKKKKLVDIDENNNDGENKMSLECLSSYYSLSKSNKKIIDFASNSSKNIYNSTIYSTTVFNLFKNRILQSVLDNVDKINNYDELVSKTLHFYQLYFDEYSKIKNIVENNNKIIYKTISNLHETFCNDNFYVIRDILIWKLRKSIDLIFNEDYDSLCFTDIIDRILKSFYLRNFDIVKTKLINHEPIIGFSETFIRQVKNKENLFKEDNSDSTYSTYKNEILLKLCNKIDKEKYNSYSQNNIIKQFTYNYNLGENFKYLSSDLKCAIILNAQSSISSFYALKSKGKKCNFPKYLKDNCYKLEFFKNKGFLINNDTIDIIIGRYTGENYINITKNKNLVKIDKYYYINKSHLKKWNKKIGKKEKYIIDNKYYVDKKDSNIIDGQRITLKIPDKIKGKNIKQIEIVPIYDGYKYKINYTYEIEKQKIEDTNKIEDCISIDLGMVNLMTIYDPTDEQYIIKGGKLISIIKHQNERINYYKKIANRVNGQATTKRINGIMIKKQNQMTNTINEIVNWIKKKYAHKKKIIIGYNEEWKKGTKMGKETNMKFQQIPYKTIINKIKNGMEKKGIKIETTEESYTSKCDALGMEEIKKQEVYMGKRTKRGLYKSSTGTKINADLNGAINIMRKYMKKHGQKMEEIKGKGLKNPRKTNLEIQKND